MPNNSIAMLAVAVLVVVVAVLGYQLYQEKQKSGLHVEIGGKQLLHVEEK